MCKDYEYAKQYAIASIIASLILLVSLLLCTYAKANMIGEASWYSVESCKKEGTWQKYEGRMANGKIFSDTALTAASWDYPFGTTLKVTNLETGTTVQVVVTDRGPNKKLYKKGRIIDLSEGAFSRIANLEQGIIQVQIRRIR